MNPFSQITNTLTGRSAWSMAKPVEAKEKPISKTERMRDYLRNEGPANCHTLAMEAEVLSTSLVGSLLAGDIEKGRVFFRQGKYHWNPEYDEALHQKLQEAIALLKRHGYQVKKP